MAEPLTVETGFDSHIIESAPGRSRGDALHPTIRGSGSARRRHTLLYMPLSGISGRVILSAVLSCRVRDWVDQDVDIHALDGNWSPETVTWDNVPGITGGTVFSGSTGALADGDRFEVDMKPLVQAIADGQPNYGWRLASTDNPDVNTNFYGFDSGSDSWTLTVEVSDTLIAPSDLAPAGVVSLAAWVAQADAIEDLAAVQVQIDPVADGVSPDFDSGEVASTLPELDLASTAYMGLADTASTFWRMRLKNSDADWSEWSDWVQVTRQVKPALTVTSPAAGVLYDPSPSIEGDVDSGTIEKYRVQVTEAGNRANVYYDSGDVPSSASSFTHQVPLRKRGNKGPLVFPTDGDYDLNVKVWDRHDRVTSTGDPSSIGSWQTVAVDTDGAEVPPDTLTADPVGDGKPGVVLTWTRAAEADAFIIRRDGRVVARVDEADVQVGTNTWSYTDELAYPNTEQTFHVRAVTNGQQSPNSPAAVSSNPATNVWLLSRFGDVKLEGNAVENMVLTEKRQTIELPFAPADVDIVTAIGGYAGSFSGGLDSRKGTDVDAALQVLSNLRSNPHETIILAWGTVAIPVQLRRLTFGPHPNYDIRRVNDLHSVAFGFQQVDDINQDGMP